MFLFPYRLHNIPWKRRPKKDFHSRP